MKRMFLIVALTIFGAVLAPTAHGVDVTLSWTAAGDDGNVGTAAAYDLRLASFYISPDNWAEATPLTGVPQPAPAGTRQSFTLTNLEPGQTYFFAIRARDEAGNWSGLSNNTSWADCVCINLRGNADGDPYDQVTISDLRQLIEHVFRGQSNVACPVEGNINGSADGVIDISDIELMIAYLYRDSWTYQPAACP